jgi:hypothetical protein
LFLPLAVPVKLIFVDAKKSSCDPSCASLGLRHD